MNTIHESEMASSIFLGRWTPGILFSLQERPHRHRQLRRQLGATGDAIEGHRCGVFVDSTGKNNDRSAGRRVPLGKAILQGGER
jgi:hypothetical protein